MTWAIAAAVFVGAWLALFVGWRFWFFHRNPTRVPPPGDTLLCAADGLVLYRDEVDLEASSDAYHRRVAEAFGVTGRWTVVATYLSIFDVHVVRSPAAGRVRLVPIAPLGPRNESMSASYFAAALRRPLPVGKRGYLEKNELLGVELLDARPRVLLVLMADWWIDQIDRWVDDGARVERGQPVAKIHMGSQVDVWLPAGTPLQRREGDRVLAGLTGL